PAVKPFLPVEMCQSRSNPAPLEVAVPELRREQLSQRSCYFTYPPGRSQSNETSRQEIEQACGEIARPQGSSPSCQERNVVDRLDLEPVQPLQGIVEPDVLV